MMGVISGNHNRYGITIEGYQPKDDENMSPCFDTVAPGYFQTSGIPLVTGREFTARDRAGAPRVAVVNDVFANSYFHHESPIGHHFGLGRGAKADIEIVGVVRGAKYSRVDEKIPVNSIWLSRRTQIRVRWWSTRARRAIRRRSSRHCGAK
jgi:hypothetical protein